MVQIKHKVTIKTKTAQDDSSANVESQNVANKERQEFVQAPRHTKKSNTPKIIGLVIFVAAIIVGAYFLWFAKDYKTLDNDEGTTSLFAQDSIDTEIVPEVAENSDLNKSPSVEAQKPPSTVTQLESCPAKVVVAEVDQLSKQASQVAMPQGTLEQKAYQVVRGDFGNGQERKDRLGT